MTTAYLVRKLVAALETILETAKRAKAKTPAAEAAWKEFLMIELIAAETILTAEDALAELKVA